MTHPIKDLEIALLHRDAQTQCRVSMDAATVERYREAWLDGADFPAVTVYDDGERRYLVDGFHRTEAALKAGKRKIRAQVIQGTRREAVLYAAGVNAEHGLQRTNDDKRRAVDMLLADPEWRQWSNRRLAKIVRVSPPFVAKRKALLQLDDADAGDQVNDDGAPPEWDAWGGRTGREAKTWLRAVDGVHLAEILAERPIKGCKTAAEDQYEKLRRVSVAMWSQIVDLLPEDGKKPLPPGVWRAICYRLEQINARRQAPLGEEKLLQRLCTLEHLGDFRALCQSWLLEDEEADRAKRIGLLALFGKLNGFRWRYDSAESLERRAVLAADVLPKLAEQYQAKAEAKRQAEAERANRTDSRTPEERAYDLALDCILKAPTVEQARHVGTGLDLDQAEKMYERLRWYHNGLPERQRISAAVRAAFGSAEDITIEACADPACAAEGGWTSSLHANCWRCRCDRERALHHVEEAKRRARALAAAGVDLGIEPSSSSTSTPLEAVEGGNVSTLAPDDCPICLSKKVGTQITTDRGEVLAKHAPPFEDASTGDRCPGSFLPLADAARTMRELDDCAPEIIRLLTGLRRLVNNPAVLRQTGLAEHAPRLFADAMRWKDDQTPGAAMVRGAPAAQPKPKAAAAPTQPEGPGPLFAADEGTEVAA